MKKDKAKQRAKQKAVGAIDEIVRAAKELAKAEQTYYGRKPKKSRKSTVIGGSNGQ